MPKEETQFKPGQSGNPNGRPKGKRCSDVLKEVLEANEISITYKINGKTVSNSIKLDKGNFLYAISSSLILQAMKGSPQAIKEIYDRVDGKPLQKTEHGYDDDNFTPVKISFEQKDCRVEHN